MTVKRRMRVDPHHCRCFSILKSNFKEFANKLLNVGFSEPIFEEDRSQIIGLTKRLNQNYQIHVKLMRTGRIESEIEYPQDYPFAHLNPQHSFSAHNELNLILNTLKISHKCKKKPPTTCVQRIVIPAKQPMKMESALALGGVGALVDLILNDGKITSKVIDTIIKETKKSIRRKAKRRKYLN